MNPEHHLNHLNHLKRRTFIKRTGISLGALTLGLLDREQAAVAGPAIAGAQLAPVPPHYGARARSVIYLHMVGAPSQLDLFDHKPLLEQFDNKPAPDSLIKGKRFAFLRGHPTLAASRFSFAPYGQSGHVISELLPHLTTVADEIAIVRSLHTEEFNHGPAQLFQHTGFGRIGRPSLGAWVTYGLGSENRDLPAYVVLQSGALAGAGTNLWSTGFLPTVYQGIPFRSAGDPVLFLSNPKGHTRARRRRVLDALRDLNQAHLDDAGDPETATRISQYEMAFRMQVSVPELMDLSREPETVRNQYGAEPGKASFANNCLLARRLVERGVRMVQLFDSGWDHHSDIARNLPRKTRTIDKPIGALIRDLKQRGLLDQTLVIWGSEFGRTPMQQIDSGAGNNTKPGRDHHIDAYTVWLAGGGIRAGAIHGATDEFGFNVSENPVHVHDLNATLLHLLGIDHKQLTHRYQGREFRLTDVEGHVVWDIVG